MKRLWRHDPARLNHALLLIVPAFVGIAASLAVRFAPISIGKDHVVNRVQACLLL